MLRAASTRSPDSWKLSSRNAREVPAAAPLSVSESDMAAAFMSARVAVMRSASATDGSASRPIVRAVSPIDPAAQSTARLDSMARATISPAARSSQPGVLVAALPATATSNISAPARSVGSSSPG